MTQQIQAVFLDSGDTLVDEATEVRNDSGIVVKADLIPGASSMLHELKRGGYRLALVADGAVASFQNVLGAHGLFDLFDAYAISEAVGVEKPHAAIFRHALNQLALDETDCSRVVMVGNNLARDIKGANDLGILSVWLNWSPRRSKVPRDESERPCYAIMQPMDLLSVLTQIEADLQTAGTGTSHLDSARRDSSRRDSSRLDP